MAPPWISLPLWKWRGCWKGEGKWCKISWAGGGGKGGGCWLLIVFREPAEPPDKDAVEDPEPELESTFWKWWHQGSSFGKQFMLGINSPLSLWSPLGAPWDVSIGSSVLLFSWSDLLLKLLLLLLLPALWQRLLSPTLPVRLGVKMLPLDNEVWKGKRKWDIINPLHHSKWGITVLLFVMLSLFWVPFFHHKKSQWKLRHCCQEWGIDLLLDVPNFFTVYQMHHDYRGGSKAKKGTFASDCNKS